MTRLMGSRFGFTFLAAVTIAVAAVEGDILPQTDALKYKKGGIDGIMTSLKRDGGMQKLGFVASRKLQQQPSPQARLIAAIASGDSGTFESLVNQVDLNFEIRLEELYFTPLIAAVVADRPDFITRLIQAGADPNLTNSKDLTAVEIATVRDNGAAVRALAKGGADVNKNNPVLMAATFDRPNALRALLAAGADPDQTGRELTPLHMAALLGRREVISILLEGGADKNIAFRGGIRPVDGVCACVVAEQQVLKERCDFGECGNPAAIKALFD